MRDRIKLRLREVNRGSMGSFIDRKLLFEKHLFVQERDKLVCIRTNYGQITLLRRMRGVRLFSKKKRANTLKTVREPAERTKRSSPALTGDLKADAAEIRETFRHDSDLVFREITIADSTPIQVMMMYIEGLTNTELIEESIITPLLEQKKSNEARNLLDKVKGRLASSNVTTVRDFESGYRALLAGNTFLLIEGVAEGLVLNSKSYQERGITESQTEVLVRGPRDAFTEVLRTNTALIRQRLRTTDLRIVSLAIGTRTNTDIAVVYIEHLAEQKIVDELFKRLGKIDIDSILESGYVEELIQDATFTPFPTVSSTERPDAVAGKLLEGRIAILVNGTPFALVIPSLFTEFYQVPEDYYQRSDYITLLRLLRLLALTISLLGPSLYIAITTFHHEMLPPTLLVSLYAQREGVPFPAFVEALMMEVAFEIIREAGLRMPRAIGQAVSIVGTLVVGLAAVEAGLVSAAMVIIVAITAISSFVIPAFNMGVAFRILRFPMMGLAGTFGLFGITIGCILLTLHLCSLRSFGVPYMSPMAPFNITDQKDNIIRVPIWDMIRRPKLLNHLNKKRESGSDT